MPVFEYTTTLPHPRAEVFAWHERPGAFARLTPPGTMRTVAGPSDGIQAGSRLTLRLSDPLLPSAVALGPVTLRPGLRWEVEHTEYEAGHRFVDEQLAGPMRRWRHEHVFADAGAPGAARGTTITDRITWELPGGADRWARRRVERFLTGLFRFRADQLAGDLALHSALRPASGTHPLTVAVSGASGLVGTQLCAVLSTGGHTVRRLVRGRPAGPDEIFWDPAAGRLDHHELRDVDVVVNLSGATIAGRFTDAHKDAVLRSRLETTGTLVDAIVAARRDGRGPRALVQASGIGRYGPRRPGELLTEDADTGDGFLADVVAQWEARAQPVVPHGVRLVLMRTGIVLSAAGGALQPQLPLFRLGVGGRLTHADAVMSWIGLDDMARMYATAVCDPAWSGPVNAVAPAPATAQEFASTLGRTLHRPSLLPTPTFGPRLVLGGEGVEEVIATDQRVSAQRALDLGFTFQHPQLDLALEHALGR